MTLEHISQLLAGKDIEKAASSIREAAGSLNPKELETVLVETLPGITEKEKILDIIAEQYAPRVLKFDAIVEAVAKKESYSALELVRAYPDRISKRIKAKQYQKELGYLMFDCAEHEAIKEAAAYLPPKKLLRTLEKSIETGSGMYSDTVPKAFYALSRVAPKGSISFDRYLQKFNPHDENEAETGWDICRKCPDFVNGETYAKFWAGTVKALITDNNFREAWKVLKDEHVDFEKAVRNWHEKVYFWIGFEKIHPFLRRVSHEDKRPFQRLFCYAVSAGDLDTARGLVNEFKELL